MPVGKEIGKYTGAYSYVRYPQDGVVEGSYTAKVTGELAGTATGTMVFTGAVERGTCTDRGTGYLKSGDVVPYSIIRAGDWKLIKRYEGKTYELFNLKDDLSEQNDLSEKMPEKVKELDDKLSNWLKATKAKLPRPNPLAGQ